MTSVAGGLAKQVVAGDRPALARAITLAESTRADHRREAITLIDELVSHTGGAVRVGISGPPGVGKSSLIEALGVHLVESDHQVAVLAVDPSSPRSGGSILGDKTRMDELSRSEQAFIRPSPSGTTAGGVARRTRESMLLCEAGGFDVVLIETVGSGQSDVAVADLVDVFVLLVQPSSGDELQGIKRGVMELADLVVVTKADGDLAEAAERTRSDQRTALSLLHPHDAPSVLACSAAGGTGVEDVWEAIVTIHRDRLEAGALADLRRDQARTWLWAEVESTLLERLLDDDAVRALTPEVERAVGSGSVAPAAGAMRLLEAFGASSNRVETNMIVSFHVAKTGGNTFATILERAATGLFSQDYGPDHPNTGLRMEGVQLTPLNGHHDGDLFDQMLTVPSIAARRNVLHGHLNVKKVPPKYPDADFVVWLRDPIDRVVSHYEFWKRLEVDFDDPLYRRFHDEGMSIEEFAAQPRVRNHQRWSTGWRPVEDFAFVGITEEYDRSLDLFGRMYDVDTSDIVQLNVNPHRKQGAYDLPDDTRAVLESYNDGDLALYREAVERFEKLDATTRQPFHPRRKLGELRRQVRARRPGGSPGQPDDQSSADATQPE